MTPSELRKSDGRQEAGSRNQQTIASWISERNIFADLTLQAPYAFQLGLKWIKVPPRAMTMNFAGTRVSDPNRNFCHL